MFLKLFSQSIGYSTEHVRRSLILGANGGMCFVNSNTKSIAVFPLFYENITCKLDEITSLFKSPSMRAQGNVSNI